MKFDFCIGNPPYQGETEGTGAFKYAPPVFHDFMDAAYQVAEKVELITPAKFLFNAGSTPKAWNEKMLSDEHLKVEYFNRDSSALFKGVNFAGGVTITYRDASRKFGAIGEFIEYPELGDILRKVWETNNTESVCTIIDVCTKFDLVALSADFPQYKDHERRLSSNILTYDCFRNTDAENCVGIYGVIKNQRTIKYICRKYINVDQKLDSYKVLIPKSGGDGTFGESISNPIVAPPKTGYTHTFIGFGCFKSVDEAKNLIKYIQTKFARTLLSVLKVTQDFTSEKWKYVPLQNFTNESDIDWSKSIPEIDQQLYHKYNLTDEEIDFVESHVKEME